MNIDTLSIARDLKATELPPAQAEVIAAAIGRSVTDGVATKANLHLTEGKLTAMEERLIGRIEGAKNQILVWLVGAIFASVGIVVALIKL